MEPSKEASKEQEEKVSEVAQAGLKELSKVALLDDILICELEKALALQSEKDRLHEISKIASEYSPVDLAHAVSQLPLAFRCLVFENLPTLTAKIKFIINIEKTTRRNIFRKTSDTELARLVDKMPSDEAVWVLEDLPEWRFVNVLRNIDKEKSEHIKELQQYEVDTAGRLMSNEFFAFPKTVTVAQVAVYIRNHPNIDFSRRIFVLSDEGKLLGYVAARTLLVSNSAMQLKQLLRPINYSVSPEADRHEVIDLVERYKISALPVCDVRKKLLGVITYEDVVEIMEDVADETMAQMAGTGEEMGQFDSITGRFVGRSPWLFVTLLAGLSMSHWLSFFQSQAGFELVLPFVPLITAMSGNVGLQCSTVLVRGMATGDLSNIKKRTVIKKELYTALIMGAFFGSLCFIGIYLLYFLHLDAGGDPFRLGIKLLK